MISADNQQGSLRQVADDPSETTRRIPHIDRTTATLLGLLFTDGCLSPKWKNSWRFYFVNKSKRLILLFRMCMIECFGLPSSRILLRMTRDGLYSAVVNSKEIGSLLTDNFGTFRTLRYRNGALPLAHLPVKQLLCDEVAVYFLQAAFSCDGGVNLYCARRKGKYGETRWLIRSVYIACAHPYLRGQYAELLQALGIKVRNVAKDGKVKIETEKDIRLFRQKVGFIHGVEITHTSRFWPGIEKQVLLDRIIQSYDSPVTVYSLPQFNQ